MTTSDQHGVYDQIALAIGDACIWWVTIEHVVHDIILHLAVYLDPAFKATTAARDILHTTLASMDSREKVATAKALAHSVNTSDSPDFYERTEELLNYVDNVLRPERNRYIHDLWEIDGKAIIRLKIGARVIRPRPRKRELQLWTQRTYQSIESIREFVTTLELAYRDLVELDNHIAWLCGQRERRASHLQPLPREWRSLARHG
jgi:hypothetical protein